MRDVEISTFLGQVTDRGLVCLFVLWAMPRPVMVNDIATITGLHRNQIGTALDRLRFHGYAAEVGGGRWPRWTLTDRGRQLSLPGLAALPGEVMHSRSASLSSSSDRSDQAGDLNPDQRSEDDDVMHEKSASQPTARDEETEREYKIKCYLADNHYHLTGEKRAAYVDDDSIYAIDFETWLYQVAQMKRDGVKIKHPAAYALMCCQKGDRARPEFESSAQFDLDLKLKYYHPDEKGGDEDEQST